MFRYGSVLTNRLHCTPVWRVVLLWCCRVWCAVLVYRALFSSTRCFLDFCCGWHALLVINMRAFKYVKKTLISLLYPWCLPFCALFVAHCVSASAVYLAGNISGWNLISFDNYLGFLGNDTDEENGDVWTKWKSLDEVWPCYKNKILNT